MTTTCPICLRPNGWTGPHRGAEHDDCKCDECAASCWGDGWCREYIAKRQIDALTRIASASCGHATTDGDWAEWCHPCQARRALGETGAEGGR